MPDRIDEAAAGWALRHPLSHSERSALESWLAQDRCHAGALLRAQAALSCIDRALAPTPEPVRPRFRFDRRWLLAGIGGTAAAACAGIVGWPLLWSERFRTARGEIRRLPLADGSIAAIDTDTDLSVALASDSRNIALARGQAWFQVAKDKQRPFIVDAGIAQVRAVGTAFAVRRTDAGVQISVTEGTVAVWLTEARGAMSILHAGQYATFRSGDAVPETGTAPAAIDRALAWREGEVSLQGETLASAVAQFNRYNRRQLVIADPDLARERLVGLFKLDNPEGFATVVGATLDVAAIVTPSEITLKRK